MRVLDSMLYMHTGTAAESVLSDEGGELVYKLAHCEMQKRHEADHEARKKKEVNATLRNFPQDSGESPGQLVR